MDNRKLALERAQELKENINDYLEAQKNIETGFKMADRSAANKNKLLNFYNASEDDWNSWTWQMKNRISDVDTLKAFLNLSEDEAKELRDLSNQYRWAISPYYFSLIDFDNYRDSTIFKQAVPDIREASDDGEDDPMSESTTSPAPRITRRYPDRLIINVSNQCPMYCRHCQRRRNFGETDEHATMDQLKEAINYVKANPEIRDVLITGGDSLMLSNKVLDWLLGEVNDIEHVEIKRLGTRALVTLPQRINEELCEIIAKYPPIYISSQFNSPMEITPETQKATDMLIKAGAVLGNQAVLLKDINDDPHVMKKLNHELLKVRIRPYYIFHAKTVKGTSHFITKIETGINIMEHLRGYTSGLAIPTYIVNAPGGYGKTPLLPEYMVSTSEDDITIRTWEKRVLQYPNKTY
ncbi:Glutamate 2,3-aminomutase [Candidatus Syntrophocurvum alkaliphilum]|uniref:Glutamate 2,3-aminomutase n=1 Tax=Candidatus Syntrophocurvum alkaliphilum TaxID=2293317 RepID=A0A6I6DI39_9FIRM|nr:glutamate 2,3-aminomutase [Candidatus Syntrophocurvum alkaliphilum]QGT99229.1 Glutamate 2,3-aminomutase [Candidatus Syntrophocurvum alkaliphilum]